MFEGLEARVAREAERRVRELSAEIEERMAGGGVTAAYEGETVRLTGRDLRWRMTGLKR